MEVLIKGQSFEVVGKEVVVGEQARDFKMQDLNDTYYTIEDFKGKPTILSIVPDIDTSICAIQTKCFNKEAGQLPNVNLVTISTNTKEEQQAWCAAEGVDMTMLRDENREFGKDYGLYLPAKDFNTRALILLDESGKVVYSKISEEVSAEPDYQAVLDLVK